MHVYDAGLRSTPNRAGPRLAGSRAAGISGVELLAAAAAIFVFLCLGVWYSLVIPPFETPDESSHYALVRRISQGKGFPTDNAGNWGQEAYQPPLYYAALGALTAGIDQTDFSAIHRPNPYANLGNPGYPGNKNRMLYSARPLPLRGANLAMHVDRWVSLLLGCLTLLLVYASARRVLPGSTALPLLVLLTAASIPQFIFISASVSNDSLVIALCTATVYWLVRLATIPDDRPIAAWSWLALGGLLGLALLAKAQALALLAPIAAGIAWMAAARRRPRLLLGALILVILPALAIAGWWFWRNHVLYGPWLYYGNLNDAPRTLAGVWHGLWGEVRGLRYSFWGLFGWFSIPLPDWIYRLLDGLALLAGVGLVLAAYREWRSGGRLAIRRPAARGLVLLLLWLAVMLAAVGYWLVAAQGGQGRLLLPAIGSIALALVLGCRLYTRFLPDRWRLPALALLPLTLCSVAVYVPAVLLPAAYAPPNPLAALPAGATPVGLKFGNGIELVGAQLPAGRFRAGEGVPVTLYLRSESLQEGDFPLFVQLLDDRREVIGNVTSHPGWGRFPTSLWQPGAIYADRYLVPTDGWAAGPSPLRATVYAGFMDAGTRLPVPAASSRAAGDEGMLGEVTVEPSTRSDPASLELRPGAATFEGALRLAGYRLLQDTLRPGEDLQVTLLWEATGVPAADYTAFVHLLDDQGRLAAGFDRPPADSRFPTHLWRPGDRSISQMVLALPPGLVPGTYGLWVGLYPTGVEGGERLAVAAEGETVRDRSLYLGSVQVR